MEEKNLQDRRYRVVANWIKSEEQEVTSGVPQGIVLALILFIIMSDIDEAQCCHPIEKKWGGNGTFWNKLHF